MTDDGNFLVYGDNTKFIIYQLNEWWMIEYWIIIILFWFLIQYNTNDFIEIYFKFSMMDELLYLLILILKDWNSILYNY